MDGLSLNIAQDKISQLRQLFPEVFREDQIDFDTLKTILGEKVAPPTQERYGLTWAGKYDAYREIQKQTTATLTPDRANSINFNTSENIFIEGENLEVLRVLQKSYYGKVKMIYIDPPYNTGSDSFIYPDKFAERRGSYEQRAGIVNEQGQSYGEELWRKNSRESGHFHSVWLSMMLPRLYLSRNLLREDGVIFVSIDDNEQSNLKLLMDEIFGAENFVASIIWQKKYAVSADDPGIAAMHDYVLCYQKSDLFKRFLLPRTEKQITRYKNLDNDPRGPWSSDNYVSNKSKEERPTLWYALKHPKTGNDVWPDGNAVWRYSFENHQRMVKENRLYWGPNETYEKPRLKRFLSEIQDGIVPSTWWAFDEVGHNDEGQKETGELIGKKIFSTPKPVRLIKKILRISTKDEDIILDFFAGSSSTAQAVLELNAEDKGNRRFITVQLDEKTEYDSEAYKLGFRTIADISRARIRKVVKKQIQKRNGELKFQDAEPLGFQAYKLSQTHFKVWRSDLSNPADILEQLDLFQHPLTTDYQTEALFTELLLKAGYSLTVPVEREKLGGIPVYRVNNGTTYMALEGISRELIEALTARQPQRLITLDKLFNQDNELLSNTRLQLREAGIEFAVI